MKKIISLLLVVVVASSFGIMIALADDGPVTVILNGEVVDFEDVQAFTEAGRTLVPFRKMFELFGAEVNWLEETNTVVASKGDTIIVLTIDKPDALIMTGTEVETVELPDGVPPRLVDDARTCVPLRFIAETLDLEVGWDEATATVTLDNK